VQRFVDTMAALPEHPARMLDSNSDGALASIPYRWGLAGGWIDQPFMSRHDPEPTAEFMERSGIATSTRRVASQLWPDGIPDRAPGELVRELYEAENRNRSQLSGSQDMIGLIYPGVSRLDYDATYEGGVFPRHIETCTDPDVAAWLERVINILPIAARPDGYDPLGDQRLDPLWVRRLGQTGQDCFSAILAGDIRALGAAMGETTRCWDALLPDSFRHPLLRADLLDVWAEYDSLYDGAGYACSGGGYLYVVSEAPVPGSFRAAVRLTTPEMEADW